jgi:hypothetical protein
MKSANPRETNIPYIEGQEDATELSMSAPITLLVQTTVSGIERYSLSLVTQEGIGLVAVTDGPLLDNRDPSLPLTLTFKVERFTAFAKVGQQVMPNLHLLGTTLNYSTTGKTYVLRA